MNTHYPPAEPMLSDTHHRTTMSLRTTPSRQPWMPRRTYIVSCAVFALSIAGCTVPDPANSQAESVNITMELSPSPPTVGEVEMTLTIQSSQGDSLSNAQVGVEGNMNHAGMKPSFAELAESSPGTYTGKLNLTMAGDWYLVISIETETGKKIDETIALPGVLPK
ncbi:MAG: FixH family protein [Planctomycetales bacterium]|nr:FixH family protein [Planctomycetales bacterium]